MVEQDYYELLGVARGADPDTIKSAYRRLAKDFHPDTNPGDPEAAKKAAEAVANQAKKKS